MSEPFHHNEALTYLEEVGPERAVIFGLVAISAQLAEIADELRALRDATWKANR